MWLFWGGDGVGGGVISWAVIDEYEIKTISSEGLSKFSSSKLFASSRGDQVFGVYQVFFSLVVFITPGGGGEG